MAKAARIDDVKRPGRVLPSATSRPILVTDHTDTPATDPMLASSDSDTDKKGDAPAVLSHTARAVEPLTAPPVKLSADAASVQTLPEDTPEVAPADSAKPLQLPVSPSNPAPEPAATPAATIPVAASALTLAGNAARTIQNEDTEESRDPDAAVSAEAAAAAEAKAKREQELEGIIASGKYTVPINAVQRRRSRTDTMLLCLLAVALLLLLADAVFDVGLVKAPDSVPHTHFFSKS